jgi:hypothetical protein
MIKNYLFWTKKLGPFPFSQTPLKPLLTYVDKLTDGCAYVIVCEGEMKGEGEVKRENLNGRGVEVYSNGRTWIGHFKNGLQGGLLRYITSDGSQ